MRLRRASALLAVAVATSGASCGPEVVASRPFVGELPVALDLELEGEWVEAGASDENASVRFVSHGDHYVVDDTGEILEATTARMRGHRYLSLTPIGPAAPGAFIVLRYTVRDGRLRLHALDVDPIQESVEAGELWGMERRLEGIGEVLVVEGLEPFVLERDPLLLFLEIGPGWVRRDTER